MSDAYAERIERFLREQGAEWSWGYTNGDHRRLVVQRNGVKHVQIVPKTPSDNRGALNCIQDIRHGLGLVGGKRVGERRERRERNRSERLEMPTITLLEDKFHSRLAAMRFDAPPALPEEPAMSVIQTPLLPSRRPRNGDRAQRIRNLILSGLSTDAVLEAVPDAKRHDVHNIRYLLMKEGKIASAIPGIRRKHAKMRRAAQKTAQAAIAAERPLPVTPKPGHPPVGIDWRDRMLLGLQMGALLCVLGGVLYFQ